MNTSDKYCHYELVKEMMQTPDIVRHFKLDGVDEIKRAIESTGRLMLTGEGSSRIFPAKGAIYTARTAGCSLNLVSEGARQAAEYALSDCVVFGTSNSGSTKELIALFDKLTKAGHKNLFGLTAREGTTLARYAAQTLVLKCGWEQAVAATKSVVEQALVCQELLAQVRGTSIGPQLTPLADAFQAALTLDIDPAISAAIAGAGTIYFAGKNNGVAEELTLKTNEIARKKSDFLEGTYAVHGIEEVMTANDVVVVIDPFMDELEKFKVTLADGVGLTVVAIATEKTIFPTIVVPSVGALQNFVYLAAGWNILIEVGIRLGVNLDKAQRARKVGNEFVAS